ncbi:hypothetical protein [Saccharothrix syringae]|uniref:Uncharacterized protein n=1 Tax=Saccharothrix syringae TaxID=103733 RepID=A0A5Q0H3H9_SACSY|nr:hypothetical protein [Saccharothrix syringae]QFZ20475.1 hypothetical protein EKG83_26410 [Saccharothrix syringae]
MSLGLVDHVMVSVVTGVPVERLLDRWGAGAVSSPRSMGRREWLVWAGEEIPPGRVRLGVQPEVPAGAGWPGSVLVWETWSLEGVREPVARAVTIGGGRMLAVGGTPAGVRVLHAVDGEILAVARTGRPAPRGADTRELVEAMNAHGASLDTFDTTAALGVAARMTGVDPDAQDPDSPVLGVELHSLPFEHTPGPSSAAAAGPLRPLASGRGPHPAVDAGPFPGGTAQARLPQ